MLTLPNIDVVRAPEGRAFFVNHESKKTTWVDPRTGKKSKKKKLVKANVPFSHDFKAKYKQFNASLNKPEGRVTLMIDRQDLFRTSFNAVMTTPIEELKKLPLIKFDNENGLDYGGLRREWFYLLSHEVFNPYYGLFEYASDNIYTLQINGNSGINPEHLQYFEFVGRIIAMAIRNHHQLDAFFIRPIYKLMLGNER